MNFALIGLAGYIAPKHLNAIKETGNNLVAAFDISDSVGIVDSYFNDVEFFTDEYNFWDFLGGRKDINFVVVCSPNFLHYRNIMTALSYGIDVICEKPVALNNKEVEAIKEYEAVFDSKVYGILQSRLHPSLIEAKNSLSKEGNTIIINYETNRGKWYNKSWKGDPSLSGGLTMNIGIHLFDMCIWMLGEAETIDTTSITHSKGNGYIDFDKGSVEWNLSIDSKRVRRSIRVNGKEIDFTKGFADLHTLSYQEILKGNGFDINECEKAIDLVNKINYI